MQNITIAGRIGRDAEIRTAGNDKVCGFTVAVDSRQGREKTTNWWRVSIWGKRGEALAQYLTKGSNVTVNGEFSLSEYEGKPQLNIRANEVALQGGGQERGAGGGDYRGNAGSGQSQAASYGGSDDLSDEVPF
jgi:single-strand DNA-binding protein